MTQLVTSPSTDGSSSVTLKELDAELLELAERQKNRAKRSDVQADDDLLVGDIHYRPVVLLLFLAVAFLGAAWLAYTTTLGVQALGFSACFAVVLVGITRLRANTIGLRLPDVLGVELPIVVAMGGLVLVHVAGRMTMGVLSDDGVHQMVLMLGRWCWLAWACLVETISGCGFRVRLRCCWVASFWIGCCAFCSGAKFPFLCPPTPSLPRRPGRRRSLPWRPSCLAWSSSTIGWRANDCGEG